MDTYHTFRYTFDSRIPEGTEEEIMTFIMILIKDVFELTPEGDQWTMGYHTHNGLGRDTERHFHVHYKANKSIDAYRKAFQRWAKKQGEFRKGTKLYSLIPSREEYIRDIDAFFRYPFKMHNLDKLIWNNYFTDEELEIQLKLAVEQFEKKKHELLEREKKMMDKTSTYDRFLKYLEENGKSPKTKRDTQKQIIEFYKTDKASMNPKTMQGYVYTYLMQNELMTDDQFIELMDK